MRYCKECGEEVPEDALYCPHCGAHLKAPTAKPTLRGPYSYIGWILILIGGILATLSGLSRLIAFTFISDLFTGGHWGMPMGMMWGGWFMGFGIYGGLIGFVGGLLAIILWANYRASYRSDISLASIVIGILLFTGSSFSGFLVLVGGILQSIGGG